MSYRKELWFNPGGGSEYDSRGGRGGDSAVQDDGLPLASGPRHSNDFRNQAMVACLLVRFGRSPSTAGNGCITSSEG